MSEIAKELSHGGDLMNDAVKKNEAASRLVNREESSTKTRVFAWLLPQNMSSPEKFLEEMKKLRLANNYDERAEYYN